MNRYIETEVSAGMIDMTVCIEYNQQQIREFSDICLQIRESVSRINDTCLFFSDNQETGNAGRCDSIDAIHQLSALIYLFELFLHDHFLSLTFA